MKILAFDCTGSTVSVAILENRIILGELFLNTGLKHSQTLAVLIDSIFSHVGIKPSQIELLAATVGPGSFTGIRIGIAIIKAMALVLNVPCVGISSCEALARETDIINGLVCSMIYAREGEVYSGLFEYKSGEINRIFEDTSILIIDLINKLKKIGKNIFFILNGFVNIPNNSSDIFLFKEAYLKATGVGVAAYDKFLKGYALSDADKMQPNYLKLSKAEREFLNKN